MSNISFRHDAANLLANDTFSIDNRWPLTKERWEGILKCKEQFLINATTDPRNCTYMDPEIAESWIRSRHAGVEPGAPIFGEAISSTEHRQLLDGNHMIIEIARPLFQQYENTAISSHYNMSLVFFQNRELIYTQDLVVGKNVSRYDAGSEYESKTIPHQKLVGRICTENKLGTTAQALCARLKRPVQLLGPENYLLAFHNRIASAAPIMDANGEIVAIINLGQPLIYPPWDNNYQIILCNTLGLLSSMAMSLSSRLQLIKNYEHLEITSNRLRTAYNTLNATLSIIDEGIINVDLDGKIVHLNNQGNRILKSQGDNCSRNIGEFLIDPTNLLSLVAKGENADLEEIILTNVDEQQYLINIQPVMNNDTGQAEGAILRLNHVEKINTMAANRVGAKANYTFKDLVGESTLFKKTISLGQSFADSPENILLTGESGTGKELFAQSIHNQYCPRGPFIAVNCAALPRNLIESELFGYEGGSFTGAERSGRPGKIELANGGTLFLDEIGDMPFELQAILLRVLENKEVMRIGGRYYKNVNFRVISATNKDLQKSMTENLFRQDLYFRLSVLSIQLPPLRQRENDVPILSRHFIWSYCQKMGWKTPKISESTQQIINKYEWPGNVRQLENAMIYAVNIAKGSTIEPGHLPDYLQSNNNHIYLAKKVKHNNGATKKTMTTLKDLEKSSIEAALVDNNNNMSLTARILGISKSTLYRKMKQYKIHRP